MFSFDDTEENVTVRFVDGKGQDTIYEVTLCKHVNPDNELPTDQSKRFLCGTSSVNFLKGSCNLTE